MDIKKFKTFGFFLCHLISKTIREDKDGYIKEQLKQEIPVFSEYQLLKLYSTASSMRMEFQFLDGKKYLLEIEAIKDVTDIKKVIADFDKFVSEVKNFVEATNKELDCDNPLMFSDFVKQIGGAK